VQIVNKENQKETLQKTLYCHIVAIAINWGETIKKPFITLFRMKLVVF
jgi:hypothetical protein